MNEQSKEQQGWDRLATNLRVEGALLPVLDLLADLDVVVFKGPVLTRLIYGDLRVRASSDNDLWLSSEQAREALRRLLENGYRPVPGLDSLKALGRVGQVALWPNGDFDEVSVDLHADPFMGDLFRVDEARLREHLMPIEVQGRTVTTFDRPLALVHLVAHYCAHRLEQHHLKDLGAAWDAWQLREEEVRTLARETCTEAALEYALWMSAELGFAKSEVPRLTSPRARLLSRVAGPRVPMRGESSMRFLTILLANPRGLPLALLKGVVLDSDDLESRYGEGNRWVQTARRALELLRRG